MSIFENADKEVEKLMQLSAKQLDGLPDESDMVNHPPHYNKGNIETIDYIVDVLGEYDAIAYCHGNVLKYTSTRLWEKGKPIEDARKAMWYLNKMVELMEKTKGKNW